MAYERRLKELGELLAKTPNVPADEAAAFSAAFQRYCPPREIVLKDLITLAGDTSDNQRAGDWKDKISWAKAALENSICHALESFREPSLKGFWLQSLMTNDEKNFWNNLETLNLGARRDELLKLRINFNSYTADLDKKWLGLTDRSRPLQEDSKKAIKEILAIVDAAIGQTGSSLAQLKNAVAEQIRKLEDLRAKIGELPVEFNIQLIANLVDNQYNLASQLPLLLDSVRQSLAFISPFLGEEYRNHVVTHRQDVSNLAQIFVTVPQTRRDVDEFLKKNGVDVAQQNLVEAKSTLERWHSAMPTDALKGDAKEFADALVLALTNQVVQMQTAFDIFSTKHKGKFYSELAGDIEVLLTEKQYAADLTSAVTGRTLEAKLREWNNDAHNVLTVDLENTFRTLEDALQDGPEELRRAAQNYVSAMRDEIKRNIQEWVKEIDEKTDLAMAVVREGKIREDLDRSSLSEILRG
jgi:hypothetical protein